MFQIRDFKDFDLICNWNKTHRWKEHFFNIVHQTRLPRGANKASLNVDDDDDVAGIFVVSCCCRCRIRDPTRPPPMRPMLAARSAMEWGCGCRMPSSPRGPRLSGRPWLPINQKEQKYSESDFPILEQHFNHTVHSTELSAKLSIMTKLSCLKLPHVPRLNVRWS